MLLLTCLQARHFTLERHQSASLTTATRCATLKDDSADILYKYIFFKTECGERRKKKRPKPTIDFFFFLNTSDTKFNTRLLPVCDRTTPGRIITQHTHAHTHTMVHLPNPLHTPSRGTQQEIWLSSEVNELDV